MNKPEERHDRNHLLDEIAALEKSLAADMVAEHKDNSEPISIMSKSIRDNLCNAALLYPAVRDMEIFFHYLNYYFREQILQDAEPTKWAATKLNEMLDNLEMKLNSQFAQDFSDFLSQPCNVGKKPEFRTILLGDAKARLGKRHPVYSLYFDVSEGKFIIPRDGGIPYCEDTQGLNIKSDIWYIRSLLG